jgi:hypothetical protein
MTFATDRKKSIDFPILIGSFCAVLAARVAFGRQVERVGCGGFGRSK